MCVYSTYESCCGMNFVRNGSALWVCLVCDVSHQWCLTKQFAPSHKITNGDVEVGVSTAPVRDFGKGMCRQGLLQTGQMTEFGQVTYCISKVSNKPTFVFGSIRPTPCLLIAIRRNSGRFGSEACYKKYIKIHKKIQPQNLLACTKYNT